MFCHLIRCFLFCCMLVVLPAFAATPDYLPFVESDPFKHCKKWINHSVHTASDRPEGMRDSSRSCYLSALPSTRYPITEPDRAFPDIFSHSQDYARALHSSYLVWALTTSGHTVDLPIRSWLEVIIDRSRTAPQRDEYLNVRAKITLLLLESQTTLEPDLFAALPYYLDYLQRMRAYSPTLFEQVWAALAEQAEALAGSPALGALYTNLDVLAPPYAISPLSIPPEAFLARLSPSHWSSRNEYAIQDAYRRWAADIPDVALNELVIHFPAQLLNHRDEVRAWHWAYLMQALVENGRPIRAPLLDWIVAVLPQTPASEADMTRMAAHVPLLTTLLKTWLISQWWDQAGAMKQLLTTLEQQQRLPLPYVRNMRTLWLDVLNPEKPAHDPMAVFHLLDWAERITGDEPDHLAELVSAIYAKIRYNHWDLRVEWPASAYQKVVTFSQRDSASHDFDPWLSLAENAWLIRLDGYGDTLPRETALKLKHWRTGALIDVYQERYLTVWGSIWIALLCLLLACPRRRALAVFTGVWLLGTAGAIFFCAWIASIGHNNANYRGLLAVLEFCFPYYAGLVGLYWLAALASLARRLLRGKTRAGNVASQGAQ